MYRTSAFAIAALLALACSGKSPMAPSDGGGTPSGAQAGFAAMVNGEAWSPGEIDGANYEGAVFISAKDDAREILISIGTHGPGTYNVSSDDLVTVMVKEENMLWVASDELGSGSVTFNSLSASGASGTFRFVAEAPPPAQATEPRNVTNGVFNIVF